MKRPNVLFILSDDQGPWALGAAGNEELRTPRLDALARRGMRFDNFFCASPVCSPARASLLTGRMPSRHGVHDWIRAGDTIARYEPLRDGELVEYLRGQPAYTERLAEAGYDCAISGKWHLGDSHHPQKGFTFWYVHAKGGGPYYHAPMIADGELHEETEYVTDLITDRALEWLESRKDSPQPFYLSLHYTAPHSPWGRQHHPARWFDYYYRNCPFDSLPWGIAPPEWVEDSRAIAVDSEEERRVALSGYFAALSAMDENVGRVLDWLDREGLREETLIVFTSDNGMNMGHHGVYGKGNATWPLNMFEESVKVPFIVSHPGSVPEDTRCDALLSQYDFMPTLLHYLGLEPHQSDDLPGRSFAPLLRGARQTPRDDVVVYDEYGPVRMIRGQRWKRVRRYGAGPDELYDLETDPNESQNLDAAPEHAARREELDARMDAWFERYSDPEQDGRRKAVTGKGQLGLSRGERAGIENFAPLREQTRGPKAV